MHVFQAGKSFAVHVQHYQNHATDYRAPRAHSLQDLIRTFRCSYRHHSYAQLSHHTLRLLVQLPRRCISLHDSRQILSPAIGPSPRRYIGLRTSLLATESTRSRTVGRAWWGGDGKLLAGCAKGSFYTGTWLVGESLETRFDRCEAGLGARVIVVVFMLVLEL